MKQVGITEKAHTALNDLKAKVFKSGLSLSKGAIVSQLILTAKPEDVCQQRK